MSDKCSRSLIKVSAITSYTLLLSARVLHTPSAICTRYFKDQVPKKLTCELDRSFE